MISSEHTLKEAHAQIEQLLDQLEKEQVAYEHTFERQKVILVYF